MAIDMDQVRAALEPDEPNYPGAAKELGPEALPHLERIITGDHTGLAAKAAYLAGLIGTPQSLSVLDKAARSSQPAVRIAAASAARHLSTDQSNTLLLQLVDDTDGGVRKVARRSAPDAMSDALRARVMATERADRMPAPRAAAARPASRRGKKAAGRATRKTRPAGGAKKKRRPAGRAAKKARHVARYRRDRPTRATADVSARDAAMAGAAPTRYSGEVVRVLRRDRSRRDGGRSGQPRAAPLPMCYRRRPTGACR